MPARVHLRERKIVTTSPDSDEVASTAAGGTGTGTLVGFSFASVAGLTPHH
jgi:hypothetical protein